MIKGCRKSVIHIKETDSDLFEEAYVVLKSDEKAKKIGCDDMIREATRVINESEGTIFPSFTSNNFSEKALSFISGASFVGIIWAAVRFFG